MTAERKEPKRKLAVALKYEEGQNAPHIVATGAGELAQRILELALQHNVPVRENDSLVQILSRLQLGYEIPPETFRAVAEILAFLYRTDEHWKKRTPGELPESKTESVAQPAPPVKARRPKFENVPG